MCQKRVIPVLGLLMCAMGCLIASGPVLGANIIFVDEAAALGFEGWPELLEGAGHTVTRMSYLIALDDATIQTLNAADLVIFSRDASSGNYAATGEAAQWNGLTVPLLMANSYMVRSSRWQWLNTTTCPEVGAGAGMVIVGDHPIFNGVGSVGDQIPMVTNTTALTGATDAGNGEALATDTSGRLWIALWENTDTPFYSGATQKPAAMRMWFGAGYGSATYGETTGSMNLTEQGQAIFLNAVAYLTGALHRVKAYALQPADGVVLEDTSATLSWKSGHYAASHAVYIGTDFNDVNDRSVEPWITTDLTVSLGTPGGLYPEGLIPGQTYYWCVDEISEGNPDSPWKGSVRSFSLIPRVAWDPSPADGAVNVPRDQDLSWQGGMKALLYRVFISQDFDEVNAPVVVDTLFKETSYDPGTLDPSTTYYWRVEEFKDTGETVRGDIWTFTTMPDVPIADDPNLMLWLPFGEGMGTFAVDWSGHNHYGTVNGHAQWIDGGLSFDGQDDFVSAVLNASETEYAVALWFKTTDPDCGIYGVICQDLAPDGYADRSVYLTGRELAAKVYTATGTLELKTGGLNLADGCWHHVVHTFGASLEGEKLYADGIEQASGTVAASAFDWDERVNIGWSKHGSNPYLTGAMADVRIYNKTLSAEEVERVMRGDLLQAWSPQPLSGASLDIRNVGVIEWAAGDTAAKHDVYFGQDRDAVKAADATSPLYKGRKSAVSLSLDGLVEFGGGAYFWRIDEVEADGTTIHQGRVWDLTVLDYLIVDDFEGYTDYEGSLIYEAWLDGLGSGSSGSVVGNMEPPYAELDIVNSGSTQAMPFDYNNVKSPHYSEAELGFSSAQDWTDYGVANLVLFVCGSLPADGLYVKVQDSSGKSAMVTYPAPTTLVSTAYTEWSIPLSSFNGVSLRKVEKLCVGVGNPTTPTAGGSGRVYFDDIRLTIP